jgi:hypothetical protein
LAQRHRVDKTAHLECAKSAFQEMGQAAFHAVIGVLALQDLELHLQVSAGPACGIPEQGNEFSGDGEIVGTMWKALWDHGLALVALDQQVGW